MTSPGPIPAHRSGRTVEVRAGPYWAGVLATALVAALIGLLGGLIAKNLLDLNLPTPSWVPGSSDATHLAVLGFAAGILAGALLQLLFLATPSPLRFFAWIVGLFTVAVAVAPFSTEATTEAKAATSVIAIIIGIAVISLLNSVTARTTVRAAPGEWPVT